MTKRTGRKRGLGSASLLTRKRVGRLGVEALRRKGKAHSWTPEQAKEMRRRQLEAQKDRPARKRVMISPTIRGVEVDPLLGGVFGLRRRFVYLDDDAEPPDPREGDPAINGLDKKEGGEGDD